MHAFTVQSYICERGWIIPVLSTGAPLLGEASNLDKTERAHHIQTLQRLFKASAMKFAAIPWVTLISQSNQVPYLQHSVFFVTYESPNKLDCSISLSWKGLPETNTLTYWASS
jgi:hypothetical protein